jgi:hypothetical protein
LHSKKLLCTFAYHLNFKHLSKMKNLSNVSNFEFSLVGAYSGTTASITPTCVGFNWGDSICQNGTYLVPFILCDENLEIIAYGNSREESHEYYPTIYYDILDGSDKTPEIWGAWELCDILQKSYSDKYYAENE